MKKLLRVFAIILVSIFFIPNVFAYELPKEGVHYFLTYPNGSEEVIDSYQDANDPKEKLIYTGNTNANGEILLCDWAGEGELRIVQRVPNGYSTDKEEIKVSLGRDTKVEFVDFKTINPYTGNSLWIVFAIVGVTLVGAYMVKKGHKKVLFIIPVALFGLFAYKAYAANCFQIRIVDKQGNPLSNVEVLVYSKPIAVDAAPAFIVDADGGQFLDGSTQIFIKMPYDGCNFEDFLDSLTDEEKHNLYIKIMTAYRDGYYPDFEPSYNEEIHDGDIFYLDWYRDSSARTFVADGNGGTTSIFGSVYSRITTYPKMFSSLIREYPFVNGNLTLIGWDDNPECSHYNSNGVGEVPLPIHYLINSVVLRGSKQPFSISQDYPDVIYACWNSNPDGIFIDEDKFIGNVSTCYSQSNLDYYDDNDFSLYNGGSSFDYYDDGNLVYVSFGIQKGFGPLNPATPAQELQPTRLPELKANGDESFHTLRIVENGQVILTITEDDLAEDNDGNIYVADPEKANALREYFNGLSDCYDTSNYT